MDGPRVPGDRDAARAVVGEQLEEHVPEAEQRVRGQPVARRELLRQREERAVGEVVAVDEEQLGAARGAVVELELRARDRLRGHRPSLCRSSPDEPASRPIMPPMPRLEIDPVHRRAPRRRRRAARGTPARAARRRAGARGRVRGSGRDPRRARRAPRDGRRLGSGRAPTATGWSGSCSARRARAPPGGRTSGSRPPARRSRSRRWCATSTRSRPRWVDEGRTSHYAVVPASEPELVDAWFRLGFGHQHVHALRELGGEPPAPIPRGRRRSGRDAGRHPGARRASTRCSRAPGRSPVFAAGPPSTLEERIGRVGGRLRRPAADRASWPRSTAARRLAALGCSSDRPSAHRDGVRPTGPAFLAFAALEPGHAARASARRSSRRRARLGRARAATRASSPTGG